MELQVISSFVAKKIEEELSTNGLPPENRLLIASLKGEQKLKSGIIIPGAENDGIAKRGTIIQLGEITEENQSYKNILAVGQIVYFGDYAGKEIDTIPNRITGVKIPNDTIFRVLSITEIIYVENNK